MELLELSTGTELALGNMHSSKIWSLCTRYYVVGSAASVIYMGQVGNFFGKCARGKKMWHALYLANTHFLHLSSFIFG